MATLAPLPRCTERGCPVRFAAGKDRACAEHSRDDWAIRTAAADLGIDLEGLGDLAQQAPGDRVDGAPGQQH